MGVNYSLPNPAAFRFHVDPLKRMIFRLVYAYFKGILAWAHEKRPFSHPDHVTPDFLLQFVSSLHSIVLIGCFAFTPSEDFCSVTRPVTWLLVMFWLVLRTGGSSCIFLHGKFLVSQDLSLPWLFKELFFWLWLLVLIVVLQLRCDYNVWIFLECFPIFYIHLRLWFILKSSFPVVFASRSCLCWFVVRP